MSEQGYLIPAARPTVEPPPPAIDGYLPQPAKEPPVRLVFSSSGRPTAAVVRDWSVILDTTLYWVECETEAEAWYLAGIINSDALRDLVEPLMYKGQWGARGMHKAIWHLPIPEFDAAEPLHVELAQAGAAIRRRVLGMGSRREIRDWLRDAPEGQRVESLVSQLLVVEDA